MRDIPSGKKMPSITMIDVRPKGAGGKNPDPAPDASGPADDSSPEATFSCPECGAKLCVESKSDEDSGDQSGDQGGADALAG